LISPLKRAHAQSPGNQPPTARDTIIRTVLADVSPRALGDGAVLFHEHLSARWGRATHFSDDVALIAQEVRASRGDGVACIVDAGHPDIGRSVAALRQIANDSGVAIVASGGYYTQRLFPPDLAAKSVDTLADELVRDAQAERHGAFGEIGQEGEMTPDERKVFQAVGKAHVRTGLPVFTHNAYMGRRPARVAPDAALRQLDLLESAGVDPRQVALGHMCCLDDAEATVAQQVAKRGAFVGFDRVTLEGILPDADKVTMVLKLLDAGCADQLLLSSDFFQESALKKNGGAGFAQTVTVFGRRLSAAGVSDAVLRHILIDNPRRFLAFVPKL
jgi:phosphotriesterase-related protein